MTTEGRIFGLFSRLILERRSTFFRWTFALLSLAIAISLRWVLDDRLSDGFPFLTFFPAIILTTFLCGLAPGLVVAIGSFLAAWLLFVSVPGTVDLSAQAGLAMGFFGLVVATDVLLITVMIRAFSHLEDERARSERMAEQRRLMFHELQHRVSNNLATVAGLLTIQRRAVQDLTARKALDDAATRINVIARMSRVLHDPKAQDVDFGEFLHEMAHDLAEASGAADRVTLTRDCAPVTVTRDQAIPLGLIATELLTNAFEHGFPDDASGNIRLLLAVDGTTVTLRIEDDGCGLPAGFSLDRACSLGLTIARQFAQQMGGSLTMKNRAPKGTVSELVFPRD
ncbi:sensor histidine kinase [Falsirhodobacter deserti]|uniref:sensor histidine kinase n=1 Tax=Falsirhodobacter deserti TaxID=1365611 RepID=UPI000FE31B9A|nr:histidine kinase dimerization/phosphoacceptor domain -containing protein [Falsirhodobacter deserti]